MVVERFESINHQGFGEVRVEARSSREMFDAIWRDAQRILELLRPDDRLRILVIDTVPYELLPVQTVDGGFILPEEPTSSFVSSLYDALFAGLVTHPDPDRRRLLVAVTHGTDNNSITSVQSLERAARRTDTVLHLITVRAGSAPLQFQGGRRRQEPTRQEMELFQRLPALTGGALHGPLQESRWGRSINVIPTIRDVIEEFRQSYVIQYTPRNVAPGGWHDVVVQVKGVDRRGVRTRAGYFDAVP